MEHEVVRSVPETRCDSQSKDVPENFKRSEIGLIPGDWSVFSVGELFEYLRTASNSRSDLGDSRGIAYVHYGDIHTRFNHFVDFTSENVPCLLTSKSVSASRLRDGDLIVADASEDEMGVGKAVEIRNLGSIEAISGLHTIVLRSRDRKIRDGYRGYLFESAPVKDQLRQFATGLKVFGISKRALRNVYVPLPPLSEQQAIAETLSDVDGLLKAQDALIAKKRVIKRAVIQQLLSGKIRLPGFQGAWEIQRLGDMGSCLRGVSYNPTVDLVGHDKDSTVRLLRANNIQNATVSTYDIHFVESRKVSESQVLRPNDILVCMANGSKELVGKAGLFRISDGFTYTFGAFMGCFRTKLQDVDPSFVYYLFQTNRFRRFVGQILAGSSINNLKPSDIESAEFQVPSRIEQTGIANVLSDIDDEITTLDQRREKVRALKHGMVQQLLTGQVRLVNPEVPSN